jgi:hypothetical protein
MYGRIMKIVIEIVMGIVTEIVMGIVIQRMIKRNIVLFQDITRTIYLFLTIRV